MIAALYELLTGRPYFTGRSAAADFGPPPGARYARELAAYSDLELIRRGHEIVAELSARPDRQEVTQ
ncbi:hypothetical protein ACPPVO_08230 [Dactylosporangium sp. McL0621]|uniref:hypothetical protein n=1 Tax=Dactylosporangium sp. McL0621 TaxID=3415678 RepID=UPI003CEF9F08